MAKKDPAVQNKVPAAFGRDKTAVGHQRVYMDMQIKRAAEARHPAFAEFLEGFHHEGARLRAAVEGIAQGLREFHDVIADQADQRLVAAAAGNV